MLLSAYRNDRRPERRFRRVRTNDPSVSSESGGLMQVGRLFCSESCRASSLPMSCFPPSLMHINSVTAFYPPTSAEFRAGGADSRTSRRPAAAAHSVSAALLVASMSVMVWMAGAVPASGHAIQDAADTTNVDREFVLESTILGYHGIGGEIDGVRNPVLQAGKGEVVRITIVNGEVLVHDVAMENHGVKSAEVLEVGERAEVTFTAEESDLYYCTIPGHRAAGMEGRFEVSDGEVVASTGTPPRLNGRVLNMDFEGGDLDDWTPEGEAFADQPAAVKAPRAPDGDGNDDGAGFRIDTGAEGGSAPTGILTSISFEITHPYAGFLVAGGAFDETRVDLVLSEQDSVIYSITGYDGDTLRPTVADLSDHLGETMYVRIIDEETGEPSNTFHDVSPWAYIAFDEFRFYEERPTFPGELRPEDAQPLPPLEIVAHAGLSGEQAAAAMTLPDGFTATLAASEPDVVRPIGFALDDRGRLWVAEGRTYPVRAPEGQGRDRILILEDTNGDGSLDSRKIFTEGLNLVSGIEVGFGGVWIGAAPHLLYIPIDETGDRPAGEPEILLDGWGYGDTHETLNTLRWGPDGWLYGTQGVFTESNVGAPGSAEEDRTPLNAAVWRYHPTRHEFEVFAHGTSNPWGLDWNEYGHAFMTVCVIPHLYHVIQGARYLRQDGEHYNPHTFADIGTIADHVHWVGDKGWAAGSRRGGGGGHAHAGAMIYLGDTWPEEYRSRIMMNNIHGYRINADNLERSGSGYTATHGPDFLLANDSWSQMLNFRYGPDGSVHVIDWYDKNQCHSPNPDVHDKTLGRIFKISHENDRQVQVNLQESTSEELVDLQRHENEWYVRHARRILQERGPDTAVHTSLRDLLDNETDVTFQLRSLWALHVTDGLSDADLTELLSHQNEHVRSWSIQLLAEDGSIPAAALDEFARMAREDASPIVRLYLASALQRITPESAWDVLEGLHARADDAGDHNLPLMVWYATEPAVTADMDQALDLAAGSRLPRMFSFTVQRIAAEGSQEALRVLSARIPRVEDEEHKQILLDGLNQVVGNRD